MLLQFARFDHRFVLAGFVVFQLGQGHDTGEDHRIHRELVGPEVGVEEVHGEDERHRQQRLVAVDDRGHVDRPARHQVGEQLRKPQHQTGRADHGDPPEDGEVVELLPVGVAAVIRPRAESEEPLDGLDEFCQVATIEDDGIRSGDELEPGLSCGLLAAHDIRQVHDDDDNQRNRADPMQEPHAVESAEEPGSNLCPTHVRELQGHSRQRQHEEADHHHDVHRALQAAEPAVDLFAVPLPGQRLVCPPLIAAQQ